VRCLLKAFPGSHDQWIEFNGDSRAYVDLRDPEARNVFLKRSFEPDFFRIARAVLFDGGVYFDCGANFGMCTFGLLPSMNPTTVSCHLFEANPALISYLQTSSTVFPFVRIKIIEGCLSDHEGTSRFQISERLTGHSRVHPEGSSVTRNIILDDYLKENRIEMVNFLKLDIEGQELIALRGLSAALNLQKIEVIYLEVATDVLDRYRLVPGDVVRFLESNGFRLFYCREKDVPQRSSPVVRFRRSNLNQLRLLEFKLPVGNLRTDLLAVHKAFISNR
jgi:FkbM family methyltransferase